MESPLCNTRRLKNKVMSDCDNPAEWKHPRYPEGLFCEYCKTNVEPFFPTKWARIKEDKR